MNTFIINLKNELKTQNITRKELSNISGIPLSTINGWFTKNLIPDVYRAFTVAKSLNTSVEFLITGKIENPYKLELIELKAKLTELLQK